jgi:hypothetical protein
MPFEMKESGLQAFGVKRGAFENARELLSQKYPQHFYDYTDLDHFTFEKFKVILEKNPLIIIDILFMNNLEESYLGFNGVKETQDEILLVQTKIIEYLAEAAKGELKSYHKFAEVFRGETIKILSQPLTSTPSQFVNLHNIPKALGLTDVLSMDVDSELYTLILSTTKNALKVKHSEVIRKNIGFAGFREINDVLRNPRYQTKEFYAKFFNFIFDINKENLIGTVENSEELVAAIISGMNGEALYLSMKQIAVLADNINSTRISIVLARHLANSGVPQYEEKAREVLLTVLNQNSTEIGLQLFAAEELLHRDRHEKAALDFLHNFIKSEKTNEYQKLSTISNLLTLNPKDFTAGRELVKLTRQIPHFLPAQFLVAQYVPQNLRSQKRLIREIRTYVKNDNLEEVSVVLGSYNVSGLAKPVVDELDKHQDAIKDMGNKIEYLARISDLRKSQEPLSERTLMHPRCGEFLDFLDEEL